jgi:hypothetical protein
MKKHQERLFNLFFGSLLMILGIVSLIYALVSRFIVGRSYTNLYEVIVDFVIPLALIYFGYYVSRGKDIPMPQLQTG